MRYAAKRAQNRVWVAVYQRRFDAFYWNPAWLRSRRFDLGAGFNAFHRWQYANARQAAFIFAGVARASAKRGGAWLA